MERRATEADLNGLKPLTTMMMTTMARKKAKARSMIARTTASVGSKVTSRRASLVSLAAALSIKRWLRLLIRAVTVLSLQGGLWKC